MELPVILKRNFTAITPEYEEFATRKSQCRQCELYDYGKVVGQSEGNAKNPTFMIVGEALGKEEAEQVRPFVGRAGQRLRAELRKYGAFTRNNTLISNVLPCRPPDNKIPRDGEREWSLRTAQGQIWSKTTKQRDLLNHCCNNWLRNEIRMLKPKIIITLGSYALDYVRGDRGITDNRGSWKFLKEYKCWSLATFHPSYVLRCENDPSKDHVPEQFAEDLKKVAHNWQTIVDADDRMSMTDHQWKKHKAYEAAVDIGLLKSIPTDHDVSDSDLLSALKNLEKYP